MRVYAWVAVGVVLGAVGAGAELPEHFPEVKAAQTATGMQATIGDETLRVVVCSDVVVRVVARPHGGEVERAQPWLLPVSESCKGAAFTFAQTEKSATVKTAKMSVALAMDRGSLTFAGADGKAFLKESNSVPRTYAPVTLNGESTHEVVERFSPDFSEGLYGLGQHQSGVFNYRGSTVKLAQNNTDIAIPVLVSTRGYGVMWNSAAVTTVDNRFPLELSFDSIAGDGVDYFVMYGPEMDAIVHAYRSLTGHAPMLPRWSYGFIQSKDRYNSLDEIREIADRYRAEHIPLDAMVQDWYWWKTQGDPVFNEHYHDVPGDLKKLHDEHVHTMISTWGMLDSGSETYKRMDAAGELVPGAHVYDATSEPAREAYWRSLIAPLFAQGWDSFWLDSAEPEEYWPHGGDAILKDKKIAIGNGAMYTNVFPLMHTEGVQKNWMATDASKRVFLLTRSAFLGQQRVGATVWSGDVFQSFWAFGRQIPGGLNYALSGMPYWTTDIGGYHPIYGSPNDPVAYQELYLRWFEFGVFCPVFRTHGHRPANEMWSYDKVEPSLIAYDKLRYRMEPYIYSLAWKVANEDYTIQRPLIMDWRTDPAVRDVGDEFMFGPALLVSPVTEAGATTRRVVLPKLAQGGWYDFWSGEMVDGGKKVEAAAPMERIPVYVRAGSIVPLGPEEEWEGRHPEGPIELRVYAGADGTFALYQDAGDGYGYVRGERAVVPIAWSDATKTLTIGARQGSYPGMPREIAFHVVWVGPGHGAGQSVGAGDRTVTYRGDEITVRE